MAITLITAASVPVVTLAQAKAWCRVEGTADDAVLADLLLAAQRHVENELGRSLGEQTWELKLDAFADAIELPRGPVKTVPAATFTYVDSAGLTQQVDAALYTLDLVGVPGWIVLNADARWPDVLDGVNVVSVRFTAGQGPADCPDDLKLAIKLLVALWFDNRDAEPGTRIEKLIWPYRRIRI